MKVIYLDNFYFADVRRVKDIDIKWEVVSFPENVFEVSTGVANYAKLYYSLDENKTYDLFIDKKDGKRVLVRVELNFYVGKWLDPLNELLRILVDRVVDRLPEVIAELKEEVLEVESVDQITDEQLEKMAQSAKKEEKKKKVKEEDKAE